MNLPLPGYKTTTASILTIIIGILQLFGLVPDSVIHTVPSGLPLVLGGLGALGIGHKLERIATALEVQIEALNTTPQISIKDKQSSGG